MCKVLHRGSHNDHSDYLMNGSDQIKADTEKHLDLTISNDLKRSKHC